MKTPEEIFQEELGRMNQEQITAVEATDGPVMVIAGPGTGKTQILAARIGYILQQSDLQTFPENILCLTYTEAGAVAMRQRLLRFIGPEAHKITIQTFHGFCNQLIRQYGDLFGHEDLQMISPIEEVQQVRELIDKLEKENPLKKYTGDVYSDAGRLLNIFKQMKKEDWTGELLSQKSESYLNDIKTKPEEYPKFYYSRKSGNNEKGDLKSKDFAAEKEKLDKTVAAGKLADDYQSLLREKKLYDFDDMILWVLIEMKTNPTFLSALQEKYLYILVDEFQDTNESQNEIVSLLCSHWGDDSNIFVVGDDDQSIFRFQGANMQNIAAFIGRYHRNLKTVVLQKNYRSTQSILDTASFLISRNQERVIHQLEGLTKNLKAAGQSETNPVLVCELPNQADEIIYVAKQIKQDIDSGILPKEIAVIYRNNKQAEELAKYLSHSNIPFSLRKRLNILEEPFTRKILMLLEYIVGENKIPYSKDDLLFRILQFDFWQLPDINEPARLLIENNKENQGKREDRVPFRRYIQNISSKQKVDLFNQQVSPVGEVLRGIDKLIMQLNNLSPQEFFEEIIYKTGLVKYILNHPDQIFFLEQLRSLFDFIMNESRRNNQLNLEDILENIILMRQYKIALEIERVIYKGEGVTLTTVHSSKGLEFEHVYMVGNTRKEWENTSNRGFKIPPNLFFRVSTEDDTEEQRRLFYVAMTRAKTQLTISYHAENFDSRPQEPCAFINELPKDIELVKFSKEYISAAEAAEFHLTVMQPIQNQTLPEANNPAVKQFVDSLSVSATQMASYLECPRQFYYNYVLKVPVAKQKPLIFGDAVHKAYENLFKKLPDNNNEFLPVEYMLSVFKARMYQDEGAFSQADFKRYLEHGENIITKHYQYYINQWNKDAKAERRTRAVVYGGIPITGIIDKIELNGSKAMVIDYKTGKPSNSTDKFKTPVKVVDESIAKKHELYGGDYWRQAVFYKILLEHDKEMGSKWQFTGAAFDFIEPDDKSGEYIKREVMITEEDEIFVSDLIKKVYNKIKNMEFEEGCGECEWCKMLR